MSSEDPDHAEVILIARGISTAVAPEGGLTDVQAALLWAITRALTGVEVDFHALEPLEPDALAAGLAAHNEIERQRIVHHMVLAELVLRPLPTLVAFRVARYAQALGITDDFVRIARRHAQGAHGLAWMDLRRSGFVEHVRQADDNATPSPTSAHPLEPAQEDRELEARWVAFRDLHPGSLGRAVWDLYDSRGFAVPGSPGAASAYLAQHDFVHVLTDYGTNVRGELEVFALIGRADPDPKGFAWLATLIGLFETGYIADVGFFQRDIRHRIVPTSGMHVRLADAIRRGKVVSEDYGVDLFDVDYHALVERPISEVREILRIPAKSPSALESGSPGVFEPAGMSEYQRGIAEEREAARR